MGLSHAAERDPRARHSRQSAGGSQTVGAEVDNVLDDKLGALRLAGAAFAANDAALVLSLQDEALVGAVGRREDVRGQAGLQVRPAVLGLWAGKGGG